MRIKSHGKDPMADGFKANGFFNRKEHRDHKEDPVAWSGVGASMSPSGSQCGASILLVLM